MGERAAFFWLLNVHHRQAVEGTAVRWLAAALRVKGAVFKLNAPKPGAFFALGLDSGLEGPREHIPVKEIDHETTTLYIK
jgi:hypothetical protein